MADNIKNICTFRFHSFTLNYKVLFMSEDLQHLNTLKDIKQMMERSSRFISLSGLSGIAAGACALTGAWFAYDVIHQHMHDVSNFRNATRDMNASYVSIRDFMGNALFRIAVITFIASFILAFIFTYVRSKKNNTPIWSATAKRLMINVSIPMLAGGVYLLKLMQNGAYGFIAPGCLIFYGLALVNAGKYTLGEVKYLGYAEILLGLLNLFTIGYGLYFWAVGFGVLHIIYGALMWWKYERNTPIP